MKTLICFTILIAASNLISYGYYQDNYGNYPYNYNYNYNYQYPYNYNNQYSQPQYQYNYPQYQAQPQQASKALEQQYDNLIVMFTKDQCPYCVYMKPIMKQVERDYGNEITFLYVDVSKNHQYASQYGFSTVPTIVYFKNGKKLDAHGSNNKTITKDQIEENIRNLGMAK